MSDPIGRLRALAGEPDPITTLRGLAEGPSTRPSPDLVDRALSVGKKGLVTAGQFAKGLIEPFVDVASRPLTSEVEAYRKGDINPAVEGFAGKLGINIRNPTPEQRRFIEGGPPQTQRELLTAGTQAAIQVPAAKVVGKAASAVAPYLAPVAEKLGGSALGRIATTAARGAAEGAGFGAISGGVHGATRETAPDESRAVAILRDLAEGTTGGAAFGGVVGGGASALGEGARFVQEGQAINRMAALPATPAAVREQVLGLSDPRDVAFAMQDPKFRRVFGGAMQGPQVPAAMVEAIQNPLSETQRVFRARLGQEMGIDPEAIGPVGRRPLGTLPASQRLPVEPGPEAQTVSVGRDLNTEDAARMALRQRIATEAGVSPDAINEIRRRPGAQPQTPIEVLAEMAGEPAAARPTAVPETPSIAREPIPTIGEDAVSAGRGTGTRPAPIASAFPSGVTPEIQGKAKRAANIAAAEEAPATPLRAYTPEPTVVEPSVERGKSPQSPTDVLNVAKLSLDADAQTRLANQVEQFRQLRASQKQTFAEADVNRKAIYDELVGNNPKALSIAKAKRLSGEALLARRDLVRSNDEMIGQLSRQIQEGTLSLEEHQQAVELIRKATEQNDHLLSDLVVGSSQKGRDLNLLRRIANRDLSPETWLVQAKRLLGGHPLTDTMQSEIRRLAQVAAEACG